MGRRDTLRLNHDEAPMPMRRLERQGYHFVGAHRHSAVKTCLWLRKSLRGEGNCYKGKFYGISAHRCVQMTPSIFCNQRCVHCWRPLEAFNLKGNEKEEAVIWDSPDEIVDGCIREQRRLISGFKGSSRTDPGIFAEANQPRHAAISLIGEPTLYPYLGELIEEFHAHGMTTFVVTNGTNPEVIREIRPTQLYISLNAPEEGIYKKIAHADYWDCIIQSLEELRNKRVRTVVRITCIEGLNMENPEGYAALLQMAKPDFIEVKAYMHIGYSRMRLPRAAMPTASRVRDFATEITAYLAESEYRVVEESEISRVVLISCRDRCYFPLHDLSHTEG